MKKWNVVLLGNVNKEQLLCVHMANEYQPALQKSRQQSLIHPNKPLDVRAKERGPCFKAAVEHRQNMHDHREGGGNHASCTDKTT